MTMEIHFHYVSDISGVRRKAAAVGLGHERLLFCVFVATSTQEHRSAG
jgi:hypothetical protein